ncbi:hypothetical protein CFC21_044646 [Triticum aestivum]|uniref:Disease resistance R13L4/SHOC-2-like LRR domain-containing protein n=2 Tax=Triticum aestivum TaxID=4565 RepID=A0A3B6FYC0_WHEAT|nr:hypothetical protein CFC21_044646 [Triticum aestivum]
MSSLRSLTVINFNLNAISGVIPEFFADFLNLSVLKLSYNHFSGWFPPMKFQLKNIRVLDVSSNGELSGHLQEFPNDTYLETLNLQYTAFSGIHLSSFSNLLSLRELGFDGRSISMGPTDLLYHNLDSLQNLQLSPVGFLGDLGAFFSWIISLKSLTSLQLSYCYSSKIMLALDGNLTNLTSLDISSCDLPQSFGNLNKLTSLRISDCVLSEMIASSIGNLKELRSLEISYSDFSGTIPSSIGNLKKLRSLKISHSNFSGTVPSSIGNLKKLRSLEISHSGLSGQIPAPIGYLRRLKILVLAGCMLYGRIPSLIANLTQLTYLDLSQNVLQGKVHNPSIPEATGTRTENKPMHISVMNTIFCINLHFIS